MQNLLQKSRARVIRLDDPLAREHQIDLSIKREDLLHAHASGNKWRKLKYHLLKAGQEGHNRLLTFGGAHSNHIYATAAAGREAGFQTRGIIRGELPKPLNYTLTFAQQQGMTLYPLDRASYKCKHQPQMLTRLTEQFGSAYIIPEGGSGTPAIRGVAELVDELTESYDYTLCAAGTGGTLAGLIAGFAGRGQILGISALKGGSFLNEEIRTMLTAAQIQDPGNWQLLTEYHCGGYARINDRLVQVIEQFWRWHRIALDPIYTGKMVLACYDLIERGVFAPGSRVLLIHTGGLQGLVGMEQRYGVKFLPALVNPCPL